MMQGCLIGATLAVLAAAGAEKDFRVIFDGTSGTGWVLCDKKPLPKENVQADGLNPHGTESYLVVYETKFSDFVLDFDYKLTKGCNSGVFIRIPAAPKSEDDAINKGINRPIEFKGLKEQYIGYLGGGLVILLVLFAILYLIGCAVYLCILTICGLGSLLFYKVFSLSHKYGEHGLMKRNAKKHIPDYLKFKTRKLFYEKR